MAKMEELRDEQEDDGQMHMSCNAVRSHIRKWLEEGLSTQSALIKCFGVNPNSYRNFMGYQKAYQGADKGTYRAGLRFFKQRKEAEKALSAKRPRLV